MKPAVAVVEEVGSKILFDLRAPGKIFLLIYKWHAFSSESSLDYTYTVNKGTYTIYKLPNQMST